jgi:hypothetical protein
MAFSLTFSSRRRGATIAVAQEREKAVAAAMNDIRASG